MAELDPRCLSCNAQIPVYGCRWCPDCYYPGIDEDYNEYQSLLAEGYRQEDAAAMSGWRGAEEITGPDND